MPGHGPVEHVGKTQFRVRVDVTVPQRELVAVKTDSDVEPHQDVYTGVRRAFRAVERQLKAYVERMKDDQPGIYYITGESKAAVVNSPHIEALKQRAQEARHVVVLDLLATPR